MKRTSADLGLVPQPEVKREKLEEKTLLPWMSACQSENFEFSFGNTSALRISSPEGLKRCQALFVGMWPAYFKSNRMEFPGNLANSIMKTDLTSVMRDKRYYIYPKTDGTRYMMLVTRDIHSKPTLMLFDRRMECIQLVNSGLNMKAKTFDGAVLDCELVCGKDGFWQMHAFDILMFMGKPIMDAPFQQRMDFLRMFFTDCVAIKSDQLKKDRVFDLVQKMPLNRLYKTLEEFKEKVPTFAKDLDYPVDGLIFSDLDVRYTPGRNKTALKWKAAHENTVDFRMELVTGNEGGEVALQIMENDARTKSAYQTTSSDSRGLSALELKKQRVFTLVTITSIEESQLKAAGVSTFAELHGRIGEFKIVLSDKNAIQSATLIKVRRDKSYPNNRSTMEATFQNIKENLSVSQVLAAIDVKIYK